ncbi:quinol:cytochrome C oxidoreductase [Marinigracilibium pacificum]|uniref:Quinol:cytochrome C oxidoreductase n=1 Tax=Marinigracilibium pacificum TaxID=2729599 RepID=A0A848J0R9_9BACT|nr:quinol:cytochrome C oxidoreductase [Marinigracilibium pacificum]NMM50157.1 quinol:cytochrome C oxidoreductase [Marinigracilibium pacificum]
MHAVNHNLDEKFTFTSSLKSKVLAVGIIGFLLVIIGIFTTSSGDHHGEESHTAVAEVVAQDQDQHGDDHATDAGEGHAEASHGGGHHEFGWADRLKTDLWINNIYFSGLAIIGVFFFAIQYVSQSGWSAGVLRVPMSFGNWLPIAFVLMLIGFFWGGSTIFHWTHGYLYDENSSMFDSIINGKAPFFFFPFEPTGEHPFPVFWMIRLVVFFGVWYWMFITMRKTALKEDLDPDTKYWHKLVKQGAVFLVFFAVSSSVSAWDWVLSIDTHWFSTMFGWYVFASWWVSGLAAITLIVCLLKGAGYLSVVNSNHLHDLGKFVFAFSIFWTYIWFSQFLLIYYANIPEETIYFIERMSSDQYAPFFYFNLVINFFFPFLFLMTRESKRHLAFLKIACIAVLAGHWLDFYMMITPGVLKENGTFGIMEIGSAMFFGAAFTFVALTNLAKYPLVAKNHPMLEESLHHHI